MRSLQEIYIKCNSLSLVQIIDSIRSFCNENSEWEYLTDESDEYARFIDEPSCIILFKSISNNEPVSVAIAKKNEHMLNVTNIISEKKSNLTSDEYNTFARAFANEYKRYIRSNKLKINISITKDNIGIDSIISSSLARKLLDQFLNAFPRSYHPLDIARLDKFTCALSRYSRNQPNFDGFEQYLLEDLKWSDKDASWCRNRVQIGYEVLEVKKNFF
jgi:hypothetical protein